MKTTTICILIGTLLTLFLSACSEGISAPEIVSASPVVQIRATASPQTMRPTFSSVLLSPTAPTFSPEPTSPAATTAAVLAPTEEIATLSATVFNGGNVRQTPVNGTPLDQINANETVRLLGKNEAGSWYLITDIRGVTGWVSSSLLTIDPGVVAGVPIAPSSAVAIAPGQSPALGQSPGPAAAPGQLPDGWRIQRAGQFELALPDSWRMLPLAKADLESMASSVETSNPRLAQVIRQLLQSGQLGNIRFAAADASAKGDVTANANLFVAPRDATQPVKQTLETTIKQLLQQLPAVNLVQSNTELKLNGVDAARIVYDLPIRQPQGGAVIIRGVQFYFIDGANVNIFTLTGPPDVAFVALADTIGKSLKLNVAASQPTVGVPASAVVSTARVTNGGNLRSAPVVAGDTILSQVCPDDQVALLVTQERGGERWYRVRVLTTLQDCSARRAQLGAEGWLNSTLIGPLGEVTPTVEATPGG